MQIKIFKNPIRVEELRKLAEEGFGDFVKSVVDIEQGIMAVGGELHADMEALLMEEERSRREHIWGVNLYPEKSGDEFIVFDSMVNLKPAFGNRTLGVDSPEIRKKIREVVGRLISR